MLPHSPRKKQEVVKRLSKEFNILPNEVNYRKTRLDKIASELVKIIEMFYQRDDISRMCPWHVMLLLLKQLMEKENCKNNTFILKLERHMLFFFVRAP